MSDSKTRTTKRSPTGLCFYTSTRMYCNLQSEFVQFYIGPKQELVGTVEVRTTLNSNRRQTIPGGHLQSLPPFLFHPSYLFPSRFLLPISLFLLFLFTLTLPFPFSHPPFLPPLFLPFFSLPLYIWDCGSAVSCQTAVGAKMMALPPQIFDYGGDRSVAPSPP